MSDKVVIIGAGQAAIAFAAKLRELDDKTAITMIGEEASPPYQRPPLSKKYMTGEMAAERLLLRPRDWYDENRVECLTDCKADKIDLDGKSVTAGGSKLGFDKLLIATGAHPRELPEAIGGKLPGVFTLRSLADADRIGAAIAPGKQALIIGGGYIGLEAASVLAQKGMKVRVVEMADRILQRVAARETADFIRKAHRDKGVEIAEETVITMLEDERSGERGPVKWAIFEDGSAMEVDLVLVGIGVVPNMQLAEDAGLACGNGIEVDDFTRTSDPDIHAAGDVASFEFRGYRCRLESVQNAIDQGEAAARVVAGDDSAYRPVPWFWSDQFDLKLQIAGLNRGSDRTVLRPGSREGGQSVWYFASEDFIAVDAINDPKAYMFGKRLLEMDRAITPDQAGDANFDLKSLIK